MPNFMLVAGMAAMTRIANPTIVTTMGCFTTKRPHRTPLVTEVSEPSAWRIHGIFGLKVRLPAAPSSAGIR